jgi:hypothetical protein
MNSIKVCLSAVTIFIVSCTNESKVEVKTLSEDDYKTELTNYPTKNKTKLSAFVNQIDEMLNRVDKLSTTSTAYDTTTKKDVAIYLDNDNQNKQNAYIVRYEEFRPARDSNAMQITSQFDWLNDMYLYSKFGADTVQKLHLDLNRFEQLHFNLINRFNYNDTMKYCIVVVSQNYKAPTVISSSSFEFGASQECAFIFDNKTGKLITDIYYECQNSDKVYYKQKSNSTYEQDVKSFRETVFSDMSVRLGEGFVQALSRKVTCSNTTYYGFKLNVR